jgi:acyl-CoA dehydrogenase
MHVIWTLIFLFSISSLLYVRASLSVFTFAMALLLIFLSVFSSIHVETQAALWSVWIIFLLFNCRFLRQTTITRALFVFYKKVMPAVSLTEKIALEAGDVWWEGELFKGKPAWENLLRIRKPKLTEEEQAFLDGPTEELCSKINDWKITHEDADMSTEMWDFIKKNGFFGLMIPKAYGGKEFSALAHSKILIKIYTCSVTVAVNVGVPNSLGPAELLMHYGTEAQKDYYLPRLARGEDIPCFALTSADAGSDATSMTDYGIICQGEFEGKQTLGMRLTWNKRYITMCPVATVLGLAFKLYDPDKLLGDNEEIGITCALIPMDIPGVVKGRRHFPSRAVFQNGPTSGKDIFVPLDFIIGGTKMAGQGWKMLVECLSVGRAISLPASGVACAKFASLATGAYAKIRQQFGMSISRFEGIEEALGQIGGLTYQTVALDELTLTGVQEGYKPSICSAISKHHCVEKARKILSLAMDIHSGKAVMLGPKNYIALGYQEIPIGVTVEGANILTRNMIIFGQGAFRCHPYAHDEWSAATLQNKKEGLKQFDTAIFGHIGFTLSNIIRAFWTGLTQGTLIFVPKTKTQRYFQKLSRYSAALALCADMSMLSLGGELKRKERVSARLGDILSDLFIGSGVLKRFADHESPKEDRPLVDWACQDLFHHLEMTFDDLFKNYPRKSLGKLLRFLCFPLGMYANKPTDNLDHQITDLLTRPNATRDRLSEHTYVGDLSKENHLLALNEETLRQVIAVEALEKKIRTATKKKILTSKHLLDKFEEAKLAHIITAEEAEQLVKTYHLRQAVLAVDDFSTEELRH